ncbi:MAG: hypothetical protein A2X52_06040 [Candidatus Rokubacteria bacterium GWC2_70_16]|nr:MAG: hypothetical protein A2X52_06040 [Candidatus Rokubacteria bacterium GWC2_70_16]OGL15323.1 MAG: hypothetical protein A3K12_09180 [Candidatus Rokubacteria bacterium RIFCSPLOWO2_12_FULL_71_19]
MTTSEIRTRRWTRAEYDRLIALGVLDEDEPVELIGGQIVVAEPQGRYHAGAIVAVDYALRGVFGSGWVVRTQLPVTLDDDSEPEPDVAVVAGSPRGQYGTHPSRAALIVEVAESSLASDREIKGSLYARAGIADYWIVNLRDHVLEVHREPVADAAAPHGWRYASVTTLSPGETVSPLAAPAARIPVADFLP